MRKLLFISALILISCSKGDGSQEVETEDNRPLIETLNHKVYAIKGPVDRETGSYDWRGFIIKSELELPVRMSVVGFNLQDGLMIQNASCTSFFGNYTRWQRDNYGFVEGVPPYNIEEYEVVESTKNTYSATWVIKNTNNNDITDSQYSISITSNNDERLSINAVQEYFNPCTALDSNGDCIPQDIANRINFSGEFVGVNTSSPCSN